MKLIKRADVYSPRHMGICDILIEGNKIAKIAPRIDGYDGIKEAEILDMEGRRLVPGYIDLHEHITGGGGENGPASRVPEAQAGQLLGNGVTTAVGLLGTDGVTRSLENLLAKTRGLCEEGVTCYMLTGAYGYPAPVLTGSVERDILLIDRIIGVKTSMSDHRSSALTGEELIRLAVQARRGGMLAGCAGFVTIHVGSGKGKLDPLFYAAKHSDVPVSKFLPTHIGRTKELLEEGIGWIGMGGTVDMTAGLGEKELEETADKILRVLEADPEAEHMTLSSDGFGSMPRFNEQMECIGLTYASPSSLHRQLRTLVLGRGVKLETALRFLTANPARVLGLTGIKGTIAEGADADFVVYDDGMNLVHVFAGGRKAVWNGERLMKGTFEE